MLSENLLQLRLQRGMSQAELAEKAKISLPAYRNIEKGVSDPKSQTLHQIAAALGVPLRDLLVPAKPLEKVRFRSQKKMKCRALVLADVSRWLAKFNELEDLLQDREAFALQDLASDLQQQAPGKERACRAAAAARAALKLDDSEPIHDICGLLEDKGVKVRPVDLASEGFFGLSVAPQEGGPAIAVNVWDRISVERWIFTAAHELGHILLHLDSFDVTQENEDETQEAEANWFASKFLMPDKAFNRELQETYGLPLLDRVFKLKRIFRVSYRTVLYRLDDEYAYHNVWKDFQLAYKRANGQSLRGSDEPNRLSANTFQASLSEAKRANEPSRLDDWDFVEDRFRRLVRKAIEGEAISVSRGAEILSVKMADMRQIAATWGA